MRRKKTARWKWIAAAGTLLAAALASSFLPLYDWAQAIADWIEELGPAGVAVFAALYILATLLLVPAWIFTVAAGALFGMVWGFALVWGAALAGATAAFLLARHALRERVKKHFARNALLKIIDKALRKEGWKVVVLLRMSPLVPFGVQNYFYGVTRLELRDFMAGSAVGMIPGELVYVFLGATGRAAMGEGGEARWALLAAGIVATFIATWMIGRAARKRLGIKRSRSFTSPAARR
jgi:uncharacterized membrane protein YdjX (TVP38/TMEM64 family)